MSDQSIATIARSLAAALLAEARAAQMVAEVAALRKRDEQEETIGALQTELCAEYRAEIVEALKVIA